MKKVLLAFCSVFFVGYMADAQDITAVTGLTKGKIEFNDFRKIDVENPANESILITKSDKIDLKAENDNPAKTCKCGKYIAAMTEGLNGEIVYMPMANPSVTIVNPATKAGSTYKVPNSKLDPKNEATFFARMTTAPDGTIYALNNQATEFLRISPNGTIQNLGAVNGIIEAAKKLGDERTLYGGDMIADAFGNLYVISAFGNVFKLNPNSLKADFIGKIKGLTDGYTVNGVAVDRNGRVVLATTSTAGGLYTMDIKTLEASYLSDYEYPIYDLSSKHFLQQDLMDEITLAKNMYDLYPTKVKNSELNIVSKSSQSAVLHVTVWDINNKQVYANDVSIKSIGDYKVRLDRTLLPGIYLLKAVNQDGLEVINTKFTLMK